MREEGGSMKITLMAADDWRAIWIDDEVYYQGHSFPDWVWVDVIKLASGNDLQVDETWREHEATYEYLENTGQFYESLPETIAALEALANE